MLRLSEEQTKKLNTLLIKLKEKSGLTLLVSQCSAKNCGMIYDVKNGQGMFGISYGYCKKHLAGIMQEIKNRRSSNG